MRNVVLLVLVVGGAVILGLASAFGAGLLLRQSGFEPFTGWRGGDVWTPNGTGPGMMGRGEVMECSSNFYAVLQEKETGRGAMEILLDPYSGAVSPEMGPNMMWNTKYGPMGGRTAGINPLTLEQARSLAQK